MPCCFYILLLHVFGITNVFIHIHVLTCVNIPIMLGHVTTQNRHSFAVNYIINHSFTYVCISLVLHILYIHNNNYHHYAKIYMITIHIVNVFYLITCYIYLVLLLLAYLYILYVYVYFSSCGTILSLIAYHVPS